MKIVKKKKEHNSFDFTGLTAGKLMAIHAALKEAEKNVTLSVVGKEVLAFLNQECETFKNGNVTITKKQ